VAAESAATAAATAATTSADDPAKTNCVMGANGQEECAPAAQDNDTVAAAPDSDGVDTSNCVIGADGSMECPPAAQDDPEPFQPESHSEGYEDDEEEMDEFVDHDEEEAHEFEHEEDHEGEETVGSHDVNEAEIEDCTDQHEQCAYWSSLGECAVNPAYMLLNCPHSCKSCQVGGDLSVPTPDNGHTRLYGKRQSGNDAGTLERIESMHRYMTETVFVNESYAKVKAEVRLQPWCNVLERSLVSCLTCSHFSLLNTTIPLDAQCKNREKDCSYWASIGECENNKAFMMT
jgi:ShK domain-like